MENMFLKIENKKKKIEKNRKIKKKIGKISKNREIKMDELKANSFIACYLC